MDYWIRYPVGDLRGHTYYDARWMSKISFRESNSSVDREKWQIPEMDITMWLGKQHSFCVLIPVINEGKRITNLLQRMKLLQVSELADIIIIDGGSTDGSLELESLNEFNIPLYDDSKNIKIIQEAMFSSTNELYGTSYKSRIDDPKYQFAGKTGTAQVKRISKRERELDLKTFQIPYEERDHALYVAFGPYKNPRYSLSIIVEHGGSGSSAAAPMATKLFKLIVDRHQYRKQLPDYKEFNI